MDELYAALILVGVSLIIIPFFVELTYFIVFGFIFLCGYWKRRLPITEQFSSYGIYIPNVVELTRNNYAWHLRKVEYNRLSFMRYTGIMNAVLSNKLTIAVSGITFYYGNPLQLFRWYKTTTKLCYWKDRDFYLETRIEALRDPSRGGWCIAKVTLKEECFKDFLRYIIRPNENIPTLEEVSEVLRKWMEVNKSSSDLLKQQI